MRTRSSRSPPACCTSAGADDRLPGAPQLPMPPVPRSALAAAPSPPYKAAYPQGAAASAAATTPSAPAHVDVAFETCADVRDRPANARCMRMVPLSTLTMPPELIVPASTSAPP